MKAIILAAGRGSRMGELTQNSPKCLVKLAGKPLLDYQINSIIQAGISEIAVVCGYMKDKIQDSRISMKFENINWNSTNMVRSLMCASEWLKQYDCIISYSDIFYDSSAIQSLLSNKSDIAITYDINFKTLWSARFENPLADLESFRLDKQSDLIEIGLRANSLDEIEGQYMGLLKITRRGWHHISNTLAKFSESELDKLDMTTLLRTLISNQIRVHAVPYSDAWGEVDNSDDLKLYCEKITLTDK